ncbi:hypothetical protein HWV07_02925 [Natronomonas salina]|uniref:hypothetical protein n=1 Tax=Natronomonas salina TaxID=1710540 RepID=UPI0015B566D6|nr:hypothetical protein [Natronomonas salina]QLD88047.1 hypothetical protein HWV07_02925 [Natronomonas salina]
MLGFVTRLVGDGASSDDGADAESAGDGRQQTRLYECPDCESVYLSTDLATCESCNTGVERVPSEHDLAFGTEEAGNG